MKRYFLLSGLILMVTAHADPTVDRPVMHAAAASGTLDWNAPYSELLWQQPDVHSQALTAPSNVIFSQPPEGTQVRAIWFKDYLLLRYDCQDRSIVYLPGTTASKAPRDEPYFKADAVELFLDPVGDARMYMEFQFSPNQGIFDAIYFCTADPASDSNLALQGDVVGRNLYSIKEWNLEGLRSAAKVWPKAEGQGWSLVLALPAGEILKRLGQTEFAAGMKFKINLVRFDYYASHAQPVEITNWAPVMGGCAHISPAGMGTLILDPQRSPPPSK